MPKNVTYDSAKARRWQKQTQASWNSAAGPYRKAHNSVLQEINRLHDAGLHETGIEKHREDGLVYAPVDEQLAAEFGAETLAAWATASDEPTPEVESIEVEHASSIEEAPARSFTSDMEEIAEQIAFATRQRTNEQRAVSIPKQLRRIRRRQNQAAREHASRVIAGFTTYQEMWDLAILLFRAEKALNRMEVSNGR